MPRTERAGSYLAPRADPGPSRDLDPKAEVLVDSDQQAPPPASPPPPRPPAFFFFYTSPPPPPPPSPAPPPPPPPPPGACLAQPGRIVVDEIVAEGMARSHPYRVYLPPCYDDRSQPDYPVLILIHGLQSTDSQWDDLGLDETADALIRDGELTPMVIVMRWEGRGLDFEASVAEVLLPHIRETFAGDGGRRTTAIGGLSRGAGWGVRIGLPHPQALCA